MRPSAQLLSGPLAAVDIGSNSFRLEIGQLQHGRYRRIDYLKEMVRLGGGLDADGMLTDAAAARGLACLRRFAQRLEGFAPQQVRAVATQTLREARNRDAFLERAQAVLGVPVEVISGHEEARLIYIGVAHLQRGNADRLVIDIGGRSTELILGRGLTPLRAESFPIGSVSLSMRFFGDGRLGAEAFRAAQVAAGAEIEEALQAFAPPRWQEALGSSGTVGAVSGLLAAAGVTDGRITPAGLRWCIDACIRAGHTDRLDLPGLQPERRAVLPGGLAILYTLATHFEIERLRPARGALRQGVIIELRQRLDALRRAQPEDIRDESVRSLQARFGADAEQALRVRTLAQALHDQALPDASTDSLRELGWACDLHEIGLMVSHHDPHRHSAYLAANVDAPGFSQSQQRRVSRLVLGQRGGLRKLEPDIAEPQFAWQVLCLRLAVIECHARGPVDPLVLRLQRSGTHARLLLDPAWAAAQPRTVHLLREEAQAWASQAALRLQLPP